MTNHTHLMVRTGRAVVYENHAQDSRVTESVGVCPTLHSQMGTGGGQRPFCADPSAEVRQGGGVQLMMATGQINAEILEGKCPTLNCAHEQPIYCGEEL